MPRITVTGAIKVPQGRLNVRDASPAELSIDPLSIVQDEGDAGITNYTYTVSRVANASARNTNQLADFTWSVAGSGGSPAEADDFVGGVFPSGSGSFAKGEEEVDVVVQVQGDTDFEGDKEFTITLAAGKNTTVSPTAGSATGTITDDDAEIFNITLSSNTNNYNLRSAVNGLGYSGGSVPAIVTVTINGGVTVGSTSTGSYAFDTGTYPANSTIMITNNGRIQGRGGNGGQGGSYNGANATNGSNGGPALRVQYATTVDNNNQIWAGGGGGGGGENAGIGGRAAGGGGGGGAGTNGGSGGSGGTGQFGGNTNGDNGDPGTATSGGSGGDRGDYFGDVGVNGASGGGPGLNGNNSSKSGGSRGNYITGNSLVTWQSTGDRRGGVA